MSLWSTAICATADALEVINITACARDMNTELNIFTELRASEPAQQFIESFHEVVAGLTVAAAGFVMIARATRTH